MINTVQLKKYIKYKERNISTTIKHQSLATLFFPLFLLGEQRTTLEDLEPFCGTQ